MDKPVKNSILIVDDEPVNIQLLSRILSAEYKLYAAKDGVTALQMAKEHRPDLILLDIIMPDIDGLQVLAQVKENDEISDIPVIFITGLDSPEDEEKGLALDAADYIYKPFKDSVVRLRVRNQIKIINAMRTIEKLNNTDQLTGVANRRAFDANLMKSWRRAVRDNTPISVVMATIDLFNRYNDTYGYLQGDSCLSIVAKALEGALENGEHMVARWSGEGFVVLMPKADGDMAKNLAEKLRGVVAGTPLDFEGEPHHVTLSIGVNTVVPTPETDMGLFIMYADEALYEAKRKGRNCVCVFEDEI